MREESGSTLEFCRSRIYSALVDGSWFCGACSCFLRCLSIFCTFCPVRANFLSNHYISYNSAIFSSISTYQFPILSINEAYLHSPNVTSQDSFTNADRERAIAESLARGSTNSSFTRLEPEACINIYAQTFNTNRGSLILVLDTNDTDPRIYTMTSTNFDLDLNTCTHVSSGYNYKTPSSCFRLA